MLLRFCLFSLIVPLAACSSGDGPSGGPLPSSSSGPEKALADRDCYLDLHIPGVTHSGFGCSGTALSATFTGFNAGPGALKPALRLTLDLKSLPKLGMLDVSKVTVNVPKGDVDQLWETTGAVCAAAALNSAVDTDFDWTYYEIAVTCSAPLAPVMGNRGAPLSVGDFTTVLFFPN